jgi:4-diphosphocytidyl-2-C-methyl-D-erythritol kinase
MYPAPAKINLNLHITGRRADGYHILDSHMVFTRWGDVVAIMPDDHLSMAIDGPFKDKFSGDLLSTDRDSANLVIQAVYAMSGACGKMPHLKINLTKHIPSGAGLGGGSSDAAATLLALNELWGHPLTSNQLVDIGLTLGAELPVCLSQRHARVRGIGDVITPIRDGIDLNFVIAWPNKPLSTSDVFKAYISKNCAPDPTLNGISVHDLEDTKNGLFDTAITLNGEIEPIINTLMAQDGCQLARMTGSGSACFGIFETMEQAEMAATQFENAIATRTLD